MPESAQPPSRRNLTRKEVMQTSDEVSTVLRRKAPGWRISRIECELSGSHMRVRHYVVQGGWLPYSGRGRPRKRAAGGLMAEGLYSHAGDAARQELLAEEGIKLSPCERSTAWSRRCVGISTTPGRFANRAHAFEGVDEAGVGLVVVPAPA
jgi:hypothetical protein